MTRDQPYSNLLEKIEETIGYIDDEYDRIKALLSLADAYIDYDIDKAEEILKEAGEKAENIESIDLAYK